MNPPPQRRLSGEALLFGLLLILHLALVWAFPFLPTQDGPGHQALAFILRQYDRPEAGLLRQYYVPNREALPNWFIFFLMSRVLVFLPVALTEKVLVSAYVLLLPLSARYALRALDPRSGFLAVLAFPFTYNYLFHMGFFNFCFSLPAFFFTVGYWLKRSEGMGPLQTAGLALLILWVYFCHPVTLVATVAALLTLAGWQAVLERRSVRGLWSGFRRWLLGPVLACLPALTLMAAFVGRRTGAKISFLPMWVKIKHLGALYSLASLSEWTIPLAALLALLFYVLAILCLHSRGLRPPGPADGLLLVIVVFLVAYFTAPSTLSGGGFINHRLNLFPSLILILWFGTCEHPVGRRRAIQAVAAAIAVAFLGVFAWMYARIDSDLSEIVAAGDHIEPDHTLLFLSYAHQGERPDGQPLVFRTELFLHAGGYIAAEKRLADLSLYEANEDYFPILYRPALNPYKKLSTVPLGIEAKPPRVDLLGYPQRTGGRVDYVLLWGLRDERRREPAVAETLRQLGVAYEKIWNSPDRKVALYRARLGRSVPVSPSADTKDMG
jgi:hypothetical protein